MHKKNDAVLVETNDVKDLKNTMFPMLVAYWLSLEFKS